MIRYLEFISTKNTVLLLVVILECPMGTQHSVTRSKMWNFRCVLIPTVIVDDCVIVVNHFIPPLSDTRNQSSFDTETVKT